MAKRGPKGKTAEDHKLDGTLRASRHGDLALMPEFETVKGWRNPPYSLSNAGKREWRRWAPELIKKDVLKELNVPAFCVLCECQAKLKSVIKEEIEFDKQYQKLNPDWSIPGLYINSNGNIIPNPKSQERHQLELKLLKLWAEFGMTPISRKGLAVEKKEAESPWARFEAPMRSAK
jgi:P27 family predicted phage terminase small subunit